MDYFKENIPLPKEFPLRVFRGCGRNDALPLLHWHDCLELNYIKSGNGRNIINGVEFNTQPGQIFVINSNERHYAFSDGSLDMTVIIFEPLFIWHNTAFDYDYLRPFFERSVNFGNVINSSNPLAQKIGSLIDEIEEEYCAKNQGYKLIIKSLLMKILALLYRHFKLEGQFRTEALEKQTEFERIKDALHYIDEHFLEHLELEKIAKMAFMNPNYFSSYFKRVMKMNISDYILALRVNHAARLLKETGKSITEVCLESGFLNTSYFTRAFRKATNLSPTEYRRQGV